MRFSASLGLSILLAAPLSGCISVSLGGHETHHAKGVLYREPSDPFNKEPREDVDAAWKNSGNGDLISYLSDCQDDTDPGLDSIVQGALSGLSDLNIVTNKLSIMQGREARRVVATGRVDGVASKIDLLTYKRNRCIYILSYVGVEKSFDENHGQFDRFVDGFRAP